MNSKCVLCGSNLEEGQIVCVHCDHDNSSPSASGYPNGTISMLRHRIRELFVMKRFAPGDQEQYQRAFDKKLDLQMYWVKIWLLFASVMIGLFVIAVLLSAVG